MKTIVQAQPSSGGVPKPVLIGAAALIAFALGATVYGRVSGVGTVSLEETRAVQTLSLNFVDREDGGVSVINATDDSLVYLVRPGADNFIRATARGLGQARKRAGIGAETPFRLTRWSDGTISLEDPLLGRNIGLDAFGPTNAGAFAQFFGQREIAR
jgi:putative photosynthetic complex assembly protein